MAKIQGIFAREILDSRGVPTIEATLWLDNGGIVATSVPTGTSVGKYEAHELRDKDANRMLGKGVLKAVEAINTIIAPALIGKDPLQQEEIDQMLVQMDGTPDRSKLGANSLIAVSQAVLKAGALVQNVPLYYYILQKYQLSADLHVPSCIFTMVSGGEHGAGNLDIQEFQIIPASHFDFADALNMGVTIFHKLEEVLVLKGAIHSVGMAGGFTPNLYSNTDVFEILVETIKTSPYTFAQDLFFGMDVAAEQIFENGKYKLKDRSQPYDSKELHEYYKKLRNLYHVFCIEDPFQEDDLEAWKFLTAELGETTRVIGDSFLATNKAKTQQAIDQKLCNTLLVKQNQVGTITETVEVIRLARSAGWQIIMSHRSGETNDDLIADFAVGIGADYVRFGPPNRGERIAKYNRLLQIHQEIVYSKKQQAAQATASTATTPTAESTAVAVTPSPSSEQSVTPLETKPAAPVEQSASEERAQPKPPAQPEPELSSVKEPPQLLDTPEISVTETVAEPESKLVAPPTPALAPASEPESIAVQEPLSSAVPMLAQEPVPAPQSQAPTVQPVVITQLAIEPVEPTAPVAAIKTPTIETPTEAVQIKSAPSTDKPPESTTSIEVPDGVTVLPDEPNQKTVSPDQSANTQPANAQLTSSQPGSSQPASAQSSITQPTSSNPNDAQPTSTKPE